MTLALEGGSTVAALMPFLPVDAGLTVLTNSLEIVRQTPAGISVHASGGLYREVSGTFVGPRTTDFFAKHRADLALVSATGLDLGEGLMDPNPLEIELKRALCRRSERVVALLDQEKFGVRSLAPVLPCAGLAALYNDRRPAAPFTAMLRRARVPVVICGEKRRR